MNGIRIEAARSLEERLAAVAVTLIARMKLLRTGSPDYADFRDAFRPYIRIEILIARLEALGTDRSRIQAKRSELARELADLDFEVPPG